EYVNQLCAKLITWRLAQYPQVNSFTAVSLVQMFNKESIQFKSESIRISQNMLPIDPKKSKSSHNKTPVVSTFISTSTKDQMEKKMFIKKKLDYIYDLLALKKMFQKKNSTFANGLIIDVHNSPDMSQVFAKSAMLSYFFVLFFKNKQKNCLYHTITQIAMRYGHNATDESFTGNNTLNVPSQITNNSSDSKSTRRPYHVAKLSFFIIVSSLQTLSFGCGLLIVYVWSLKRNKVHKLLNNLDDCTTCCCGCAIRALHCKTVHHKVKFFPFFYVQHISIYVLLSQ
ncbi:hypothetical protein RFI_36784, partial [Reticulomyxa filosa]